MGELDHLAFYVLDGFVSLLDVAEGGRGLSAAVGVEELRVSQRMCEQQSAK